MAVLILKNLPILLLLSFLASCSDVVETAQVDILRTETITPVEKVNDTDITSTPSITATVDSPTPSITASPEPELITNTAPPIQPTWTPLPTLSVAEAQAKVIDLLTNNAGCELPCWWGVMPGRSKWEETEHFIASFVDRIGQGGSKKINKDGVEYDVTSYSLYVKLDEYEDFVSAHFGIKNGLITSISVSPRGTELRYSVDQVLSLFGQPNEIILEVEPITMVLKPWVSFYLYYPDQGIIALYDGEATLAGGKIEMCPEGISPKLILVPPGSMTLEEMIKTSYSSPYRLPSINENPGWSVERFYKEMKEPGSCFVVEPTE